MSVPAFLEARRSIRAFSADRVPRAALTTMIEAACIAPAPHHSRPWRWVVINSVNAKQRLANGMGDHWRIDLERDGLSAARIEELVAKSHVKIMTAPSIILGCLTWNGLDSYPDEIRQRAEFGMALLSLGGSRKFDGMCRRSRLRLVLGRGANILPRYRTRFTQSAR